jgi:pseudouridine kinase
MSENASVLVIGAAAIDTKGKAYGPITPGLMNPGHIRVHRGGVGRNIAENLSRLGISTRLISAVGDDISGKSILAFAAESGIDVEHVLIAAEANTGAYIAVYDEAGQTFVAMYHMSIMNLITPRYLYDRRRLFGEANLVVIDANLPPRTIDMVFKLARQYDVPVCADPTSNALALKLKPHLPNLYMVTPDMGEAELLTDMKIKSRLDAMEAAKRLIAQGVDIALVTQSDKGVCYATQEVAGHMPAIATEVVDLTGAGDAMTAAVVFGLLEGFHVDEAIKLGISASSLAIQCRETVCPSLSLEHLYDHLRA